MGVYDLEMWRGDDRTYTMTATIGGSPLNLTGAAMRFTAKLAVEDADAAAIIGPLTVGSGITITDAPNGVFTVAIPAAETIGLTEETSTLWDVEITISGVKRTVPEVNGKPKKGTLKIRMDVSSA